MSRLRSALGRLRRRVHVAYRTPTEPPRFGGPASSLSGPSSSRSAGPPGPVVPQPAPAGTRWLEVDGAPVLVHDSATFAASAVLADHLALVADALGEAEIPYAVLSAETQRRRVVVVAAEHGPAAWRALATALGGSGTYAGVPKGVGVAAADLVEDRSAPPTELPAALRVFRYRAVGDRLVSGPELGCDLQVWARADAWNPASKEQVPDSLVGPRSAARTPDLIPPDRQQTSFADVDGTERPRFAALALPHLLGDGPEIDVVYTWVDGADPAWQARKDAVSAEGAGTTLHTTAAHASRFTSREELRYSLRSLAMYAGWVRHVFLVTDDQVPDWLVDDHPGLTVVSHRELFGGRGRLPTFNSHAIETQLHHVPGLGEHFLYLNDDVFFARPVEPSLFVLPNGLTRFFLSTVKITPGAVSAADRPYTIAAKNNRVLLERRFGRTVTAKFQHTPFALRRSVLLDLDADFPAEIAATAAAQFRSADDVSVAAALAHYYAYATGRAVPGKVAYAYVDIGLSDAAERLATLLDRRDLDVFCVNDNEPTDVDPEDQSALLRAFLEARFPVPSPWER